MLCLSHCVHPTRRLCVVVQTCPTVAAVRYGTYPGTVREREKRKNAHLTTSNASNCWKTTNHNRIRHPPSDVPVPFATPPEPTERMVLMIPRSPHPVATMRVRHGTSNIPSAALEEAPTVSEHNEQQTGSASHASNSVTPGDGKKTVPTPSPYT